MLPTYAPPAGPLPLPHTPLIGVVHLLPLPGSARAAHHFTHVVDRAVEDARSLQDGGADAVLVENFHDCPFHKDRVPPHTVAAMTAAVLAVRNAVDLPLGVNVLRNDVRSALAIAHVCGATFVRCNVYVGAAVTDQGIIEGAARTAIAYRAMLGARVLVLADVDVKHATQLGGPPIAEQARDATARGLADAVIVTGPATGAETPIDRLRVVKAAVPTHTVLAGSGVTPANAEALLQACDGAIVGSYLHADGDLAAPVDARRVAELASLFRAHR